MTKWQPSFPEDCPKLHDYQKEAVSKALLSPSCRWIFNDEMGLGKTPEAILAARTLNPSRVLIVTPAIVRRHWEAELRLWWPNHPRLGLISHSQSTSSLTAKTALEVSYAYAASLQIVSYNLLHEVDKSPWDVIIFDEAHKLQSPASLWSKAAKEIATSNPTAAIFMLTATIMPKRPVNAWNMLDTLQKGKWGWSKKDSPYPSWWFAKRYSIGTHNGYGWKFDGVNQVHITEFKEKLQRVSSRTTKFEVAHLLPAFSVQKQMISKTDNKLAWVADWVANSLENETTHIAILTHLKATSKDIADYLRFRKLENITEITGELQVDKRIETLKQCKAQRQSIIVGTMHSMGVGIDMTFCTQTLIVELFERPETIIQVLGRFSRLSGKLPSTVTFMLQEGTEDEKKMFTLQKNIEAINQAIRAGQTETKLCSVFTENLDGAEFLSKLKQAVSTVSFMED